jgi:hypothetical protein
MFNLFGTGAPKNKVIDKVWISKEAKWKACAAMAQLNPLSVFIAWFEGTAKELEGILGSSQQILLAERVDVLKIADKMVVFAEHYPLPRREEMLFETLKLKEIPIVSSLDEPLFMKFSGERTIELMRKLGMNEDEPIGHSMITASIRNAQKKLEKQVITECKATSAAEWFALNAPN